jgi:DNA helicase-2/ATP-dependent DNA helicase PcrA
MDDLTPSQREAVSHVDGPLLVLAGPGSGKTRVVTRRISALVESGVAPWRIVAITFTNKAAGEMQERVEALLPGTKVWVSTFHRFCARILRKHAATVGLQSNFTILDTGDQKQIIRRVMADLDYDSVHFPPEKVLWRISNAKNDLLTPERYAAKFSESVADHWQAIVARAYPAYEQALLASNAVDFDDLLLHVATMLDEHEELREQLSERFRYVLVDEYQDTNIAQYRIAAALASQHGNIQVTGDPDQSIYGWRGARIENILRFERDFPSAKIVRLEQNFRSTAAILRSADSLISYNSRRKAKQLFSELGDGHAVQLWQFETAEHEADSIARRIRAAVDSGKRTFKDFAVFYRVNALSRNLERAFRRHRVQFQIAAGFAFYERAEVKELLAYLRLIYNPADRAAFLRVVNTPLRGLGKTSQDRLTRWADNRGLNDLDAAARADEIPKLSKRAVLAFQRFAKQLEGFTLADAGSIAALLERIVNDIGYVAPWIGSSNDVDQQRLANVQELVAAARDFDGYMGAETSLEGFLEQTSLVSDTDRLDPDAGQVTLMTLHAAKGLEFPVVFIVGVEQGLLPHDRAVNGDADPHELEEERRLLFVGMTRAREELHLSFAERRSLRGQERLTIPSAFLREVDAELIRDAGPAPAPGEYIVEPEPDERPVRSRRREGAPQLPGDLKSRLKTGADLLNGTSSAVELPQGFAVGSRVRHPRYGLGVVTEVSGFGSRRTVTVRFQDDGRQQSFDAARSPLQLLGVG